MRVRLPPAQPTLVASGVTGNTPRSDRGKSRFEALLASQLVTMSVEQLTWISDVCPGEGERRMFRDRLMAGQWSLEPRMVWVRIPLPEPEDERL